MADTVEVHSQSELSERKVYPVSSGGLRFHVRTHNGRASLLLLSRPELRPIIYQIRFVHKQGNSYECTIMQDNRDCATATLEDLVSDEEYRCFWVTWWKKQISVGKDGDVQAFVVADIPRCNEIQYVLPHVVRDENCMWKFEPPLRPKMKEVAVTSDVPEWKEMLYDVAPADALIAGNEDGKPLYAIRGLHEGSMVPGKLKFGETIGYVAWGGTANPKAQYEILVGYNAHWEPTTGGAAIPNGAVCGGYAEVTREPLYVGRAHHEGHLIVGKVQRSHKVLYIPYMGKEIAKNELEILVANHMHSEESHGVLLKLPENSTIDPYESDEENEDQDQGNNYEEYNAEELIY